MATNNSINLEIVQGGGITHTFPSPATGSSETLVGRTSTDVMINKTVNGVVLSTAQGTSNFLRGDGTYAAPSGGGGGISVLGTIGSSPNASGATITGSTLTLQAASESFGGVLTTGIQGISGAKTFVANTTFTTGLVVTDFSAPVTITPGLIQLSNSAGFASVSLIYAVGFTAANITLPQVSGTIPMTVNTVTANTSGNITLTSANVGAEPALGNPTVSGYILSSTTGGVRSWVPNSGGGGGGDVVGPSSATTDNIVLFDGVTGKLIKDAGKGIPSGTIVGTTDTQTLSNKETINLLNYGAISHEEQGVTPANPSAGFIKVYARTDGNIYKLTSAGVETVLGGGGGGGGITRSVNNVSSDTTASAVASTDYVYFVTNTTTITLPTAVGNTNMYTIKNVGTGTISIATTSSETIDDGAAPITITRTNNSLDFISDNSNWKII